MLQATEWPGICQLPADVRNAKDHAWSHLHSSFFSTEIYTECERVRIAKTTLLLLICSVSWML